MIGCHNLKGLAWETNPLMIIEKTSLPIELYGSHWINCIMNIGHKAVNHILRVTLLWVRNSSKAVNPACLLDYFGPLKLPQKHGKWNKSWPGLNCKIPVLQVYSNFQQPIPSVSPQLIPESQTYWFNSIGSCLCCFSRWVDFMTSFVVCHSKVLLWSLAVRILEDISSFNTSIFIEFNSKSTRKLTFLFKKKLHFLFILHTNHRVPSLLSPLLPQHSPHNPHLHSMLWKG